MLRPVCERPGGPPILKNTPEVASEDNRDHHTKEGSVHEPNPRE